MDPIQTLEGLFNLGMGIKNKVDTVCANKKQCRTLYQRIELVLIAIRSLEYAKDVEHYLDGLNKLQETLEECSKFVAKFIDKNWFKKIIKASDYKEEFDRLNQDLLASAQILQLGIDTQQIINHRLDQEDQAAFQQELLNQFATVINNTQDIKQDTLEIKEFIKQREESMRMFVSTYFSNNPEQQRYPIDKNRVIPFFDLECHKLLDEGIYGRVYFGSWDEQPVAIKTLKALDVETHAEFIREVKVMDRLRSPHIVQFYGACFEEGRECIIMEYMPNGSLKNYLKDYGKTLTGVQQKQLLLEIAYGLDYLHRAGHIHSDLKSANILINQDGHAKIADFGLVHSRTKSIVAPVKQSESLAWVSPEIINRTSTKMTRQTDIYSFGILLWEVVTGQFPGNNEEAKKRVALRQQLTIPSTVPSVYTDIMQACWSEVPSQRPDLKQIINRIDAYQPATSSEQSAEDIYLVGFNHERNGDDEKARIFYQQSADQGYARACCNLGMFAIQGRGGLEKNKPQGFILLEQAAKKELPRAQYNLAVMLAHGDGVTKNIPLAIEWFEKAAAQGHKEAEVELAECLRILSKHLTY